MLDHAFSLITNAAGFFGDESAKKLAIPGGV